MELFRAGDRLVGVEYDTVETRDTLRSTCGRWLPDGDGVGTQEVPAAYGVRTAKVGFRRRKVGIVHHGAPIRYRLDTPQDAVEVMERILADVARERSPGAVSVDARCFVRERRAVLVDVPLSRDVDERPLREEGFEEVPAWRPMVHPDGPTVDVAGRIWELAGVAVVRRPIGGPDSLRSHVWHLAEGDVLAWAELVDVLGDGLVADADDVLDACRRLLR